MKILNFVLGAYIVWEGKELTKDSAAQLRKEIEQTGAIQVGRMDVADTKQKVSDCVTGSQYDVLICQEKIREMQIGGGSIAQWRAQNPMLRVILLVDENKKGAMKLNTLYKDGYYDALFTSDFEGKKLVELLLHPRTKEEAYAYYGLPGGKEEKTEPAAAVDMPGGQKEDTAENLDEMFADLQHFTEKDEEEFHKSMERLDAEIRRDSPDFGVKPYAEEQEEERFGDIFGPAPTQSYSDVQMEKADRASERMIMKDFGGPDAVPAPVPKTVSLVPRKRSRPLMGKINLRGMISMVLEPNVLVVDFDEVPVFGAGMTVADYQFTLLIENGERGHMEGSGYKTGLHCVKAYGNAMIDIDTAVLEILDMDISAAAAELQDQYCNMILIAVPGGVKGNE